METQFSTKYGTDSINGRTVPRLIVNGKYTLTGTHPGGIYVESGELFLEGILQGSLDIQANAKAYITGQLQGSIRLARGSNVTVVGSIQGSANVERDATLIIESNGKLAGSLNNDGRVILRGAFGGSQSGENQIEIEENGYIKRPIVKDGANYYQW